MSLLSSLLKSRAVIYFIIAPLTFVLLLFLIFSFILIPTESVLLLALSVGGVLAITQGIVRSLVRRTPKGAKSVVEDERRLVELVRLHGVALTQQIAAETIADPYGNVIKDKSQRAVNYFLKSTGFRSSVLDRQHIDRIIRREIARLN